MGVPVVVAHSTQIFEVGSGERFGVVEMLGSTLQIRNFDLYSTSHLITSPYKID